MKTPEAIISEFEHRQSVQRVARRSKFLRRGFEMLGWWATCAICLVWLYKKNEVTAAILPFLFTNLATASVTRRWKLEDRLAELERHAAGEPNQSPEPMSRKRHGSS